MWLLISRRTLGKISVTISVVTRMPCRICLRVQNAGSFCAQMTIWRATGVDAFTDESEQEKVEIFPGTPVGCEGHAMSL